jgi:hypothetical protein
MSSDSETDPSLPPSSPSSFDALSSMPEATSHTASSQTLRRITQTLTSSVDQEDITDTLFPPSESVSGATSGGSNGFPYTIQEVFDFKFENYHWVDAHQRSAVGSLNDELEL